jgi:oxamate carbamoyltransferase
MTMQNLTIAEIHQALRAKRFSATELARQTLSAIQQANPQLNAWTTLTADRCLQAAALTDQSIHAGKALRPLDGIPYAVKNLFDVKDHITLAGAELFANNAAATKDAFAIQQLSKAGAGLCGMLNMDAYAYGFTTENSHYGATRNPHDLQRTAGGSSGGSAAAVAAGLVNFSLGSDTNGSIRVPASLSGVFGLKPTFGRLSRQGSHPFVASLDHIGPFSRSVADLALVYDCLLGLDPLDIAQAQQPIENISEKLSETAPKLRYAVLNGYYQQLADADALQAVQQVALALNCQQEVTDQYAAESRAAAFIISASEGGNQYLPLLKTAPERFETNSRERLLAGAMIPAHWYIQAQRFRAFARQQARKLFQNADILIAPATPCSATLLAQETFSIAETDYPVRASMGMLTQPISFLGLPVVTVPLRTAAGLPIGVQLIAAPFKEAACLQAAAYLEAKQITESQPAEIN